MSVSALATLKRDHLELQHPAHFHLHFNYLVDHPSTTSYKVSSVPAFPRNITPENPGYLLSGSWHR